MITINSGWTDFKSFINTRSINHQSLVVNDQYYLTALDGVYGLTCQIKLDTGMTPRNSDVLEYEATFLALANKKLTPQLDSDNASFSRTKEAPTGFTYQLKGFEFTTSTLSSLVSKTETNADAGDATLKFYNASGVEVTDPTLTNTIVKTVVDLEPAYDYYIIGGLAKILATPANDVRLSVIAAPDVPFSYGGSRVMIKSVNFKYVGANDKVDADGRASKMLTYSATYHSSKLRFIVFHNAGETHSFGVFLEHYKI